MKILYVIDTLNASGAERSLVQIAAQFKSYTAVFVHIYKGDMLKMELEGLGIRVYSLNVEGNKNYKVAKERLRKVYIKESPDIIHSTLFRSDLLTRELKSEFKIPLISSFVNNSYNPLRFEGLSLSMKLKLRLVQLFDTLSSRKVDLFISNSETIKNAKAASTLVKKDRVKVIYRGRDTQNLSNIEEQSINAIKSTLNIECNRVLLNVSRLIQRKGQMDLILAMPYILERYPDIVLLIAGHGKFEDDLAEKINELGIQDNVKLLGRRNDIPVLLAMADVFVYPSYFEGLPGALIEAMLAGKLIVCSDIPENLECVNSKSAVIFERGNVEDYVNKLFQALGNYEGLKDLPGNARKIAIDKFDIKKISASYERTYTEVLSKFH